MTEINQNPPATVPAQREAVGPVKKSTPVIIALVVIVGLIGIANVSSLVSGKKRSAPPSALPMRPCDCESAASLQLRDAATDAGANEMPRTSNASRSSLPRCSSFRPEQAVPGPEAAGTPTMTAAQRSAIYGDSPNAPQQTSNVSQAQAEAKQKALEREKLHQDALNSDTVAIDFSHPKCRPLGSVASKHRVLAEREEAATKASAETAQS